MSCNKPATGPRYLDPLQAVKVPPVTHKRYRKAVGQLCSWLFDNTYNPCDVVGFDDLLVEWRFDCNVSKSIFEGALAGLEFLLVRLQLVGR